MLDLRQVISGAWIRAVADIKDAGEVLMGYVSDPDGGNPIAIDTNKQDIYVKVIDTVSNLPLIGRLFAPGNGFWRLPKTNDAVVILRGREAHGPGAPVVLHGDGGYNNAVPQWLGTSDAGISVPENLHLESTQNKVQVNASSTVELNGNAHPAPLFDTFESDFASAWNALIAVLQAGTQGSPAAQQLTGLPAVLTQLQTFATNMTNGTYNSQKVKNG